jgi:hypothetical protein
VNLKAIKRPGGDYALGEWGRNWTADRALAYRFRFEDDAREAAALMDHGGLTVVDIDDGDRVLATTETIDALRERLADIRRKTIEE